MKKFRFLMAFSLFFVLVFSSCGDKEVIPQTQVIIEPVGANYLVLKPSKFITKAEDRLPVIYLEHLREKSGALKTNYNDEIFSVWYQKDGSAKKIIDLTYYDKKFLPASLNYVVLDTIDLDYSMYESNILYPAMINAYLSRCQQLTKEESLVMPGEKSFFDTKVKIKHISSWVSYDLQKKKMLPFNTETIKDDIRILPLLLVVLFFIATLLMAFNEANKKNYWRFVIIISLFATIILIAFLVSSVSLVANESSPNYTWRILLGCFCGLIFALIFAAMCWIENTKAFTNYKKVYLIFVAAVSGSSLFKIMTSEYTSGWQVSLIVFLIIFSPVLIVFVKMLWHEKQEKNILKDTKK